MLGDLLFVAKKKAMYLPSIRAVLLLIPGCVDDLMPILQCAVLVILVEEVVPTAMLCSLLSFSEH